MRHYKKYMRTEEVEAFAYMLDTPIYTCVENQGQYFWQRLPHPSSPSNVSCDRSIYLLNENVHFQLVLKPWIKKKKEKKEKKEKKKKRKKRKKEKKGKKKKKEKRKKDEKKKKKKNKEKKKIKEKKTEEKSHKEKKEKKTEEKKTKK